MKYIVELKKEQDIIDLCYAVKDVGKVISTEYTIVEKALNYIEEETKDMPLNGCKIRLLDIKEILKGGKNV